MYAHVTLFTLFLVKLVGGHLKDMGEVTVNWTAMFYELEDRIVGGEPTNLKRYPFNIQFFNYGGMCGGTILTSKTVMTAAHCFDHNQNIAEMTVLSSALVTINIEIDIILIGSFRNTFNHSIVLMF